MPLPKVSSRGIKANNKKIIKEKYLKKRDVIVMNQMLPSTYIKQVLNMILKYLGSEGYLISMEKVLVYLGGNVM